MASRLERAETAYTTATTIYEAARAAQKQWATALHETERAADQATLATITPEAFAVLAAKRTLLLREVSAATDAAEAAQARLTRAKSELGETRRHLADAQDRLSRAKANGNRAAERDALRAIGGLLE